MKRHETIQCRSILDKLMKHEDSYPFLRPVDLNMVPDYLQIIKNPMDFTTIQRKLVDGAYGHQNEFADDIRLIFTNCSDYNPEGSEILEMSNELSELFESEFMISFDSGGRLQEFMSPAKIEKQEEILAQITKRKKRKTSSEIGEGATKKISPSKKEEASLPQPNENQAGIQQNVSPPAKKRGRKPKVQQVATVGPPTQQPQTPQSDALLPPPPSNLVQDTNLPTPVLEPQTAVTPVGTQSHDSVPKTVETPQPTHQIIASSQPLPDVQSPPSEISPPTQLPKENPVVSPSEPVQTQPNPSTEISTTNSQEPRKDDSESIRALEAQKYLEMKYSLPPGTMSSSSQYPRAVKVTQAPLRPPIPPVVLEVPPASPAAEPPIATTVVQGYRPLSQAREAEKRQVITEAEEEGRDLTPFYEGIHKFCINRFFSDDIGKVDVTHIGPFLKSIADLCNRFFINEKGEVEKVRDPGELNVEPSENQTVKEEVKPMEVDALPATEKNEETKLEVPPAVEKSSREKPAKQEYVEDHYVLESNNEGGLTNSFILPEGQLLTQVNDPLQINTKQGEYSETVLHYAVRSNIVCVVDAICKHPLLNPLIVDASGFTPLDRAKEFHVRGRINTILRIVEDAYRKRIKLNPLLLVGAPPIPKKEKEYISLKLKYDDHTQEKHCNCCHICKSSISSRPRQFKGCDSCNYIICENCFGRHVSLKWADAMNAERYICPVCLGICLCHRCVTRGPPSWFGIANPNWRDPKTVAAEVENYQKKVAQVQQNLGITQIPLKLTLASKRS
eukprot:TRINITY_DN6802_c0_g1_i1.p1 TRINITY_DN6802_c0_g1~~TRINITY_DN6802_c0_g1_i1.p1  ORF type:complete len:787 (+),score=170.39 TRINITY_DN6802_c0_g1_i1:176-2536(+)